MLKCLMVIFLMGKVACDRINTISTYKLTVYTSVGSVGENVTSSGQIQLEGDAFHLLVSENISSLHENLVNITNDLSVLQIVNSSVASIEPGAFRIVPTLSILSLSSNLLTSIKKGVFNQLKVKELDVSRNLISAIDEEAFDSITTLEIVKLSYNAIKQINPNWFHNSPNVYKLSIIYNELTDVPAHAFKNLARTRPLKLRLSANRIRVISHDTFKDCGDIDSLTLNGNKLVTLPEELFVNRTIKILQVNTNRLTCFPETLYDSTIHSLAFIDNAAFNCTCLRKVKRYVEENKVGILYPSIICEDRDREVNLVFNYNKTYEIPLPLPSFV